MIFYDINNINIKFLFEKSEMLDISDEEYFSDKYKDFISNSKIAYINPSQNGCPYTYKYNENNINTSSLLIGSLVHLNVLQNINPKSIYMDYPKGEKLNLAIKDYIENIKLGMNKEEALVSTFNKKIYYPKNEEIFRKKFEENKGYIDILLNKDNETFLIDFKEGRIVDNCINSLMSYKKEYFFNENKDCRNEITILCPIEVTFKDSDKKTILNFKCKIDNFIIDDENKTIILNDLKTTYHDLVDFNSSILNYHYKRQMALYLYVLSNHLRLNKKYKDYLLYANIIAVSTRTFESKLFQFSQDDIIEGAKEFIELIKRIGFHETFGYDKLIDTL